MAGAQARCERQPTRKVGSAIQLPTSDQQIGHTASICSPSLSFAEWQLIDLGEDEHVVPVVVVWTVVSGRIVGMRSAIEVCHGMLKSVIAIEGQTIRKTLFHNYLQRVVFVVEVIPEVSEARRPAVQVIKRLTRIVRIGCRLSCEAGIVARQLCIVKWVIRAAADCVRPFVSHIGDGGTKGRSQLPLYRSVPGIYRREPVIEWTNKRVQTIGQQWPAVGAYTLRLICRELLCHRIDAGRICNGVAVARGQRTAKCCRWIQRERSIRQEKGRVEVLSI